MQKVILNFVVIAFVISSIFLACNAENEMEEMEVEQVLPVDRVAMLTNIFDNAAAPAYEIFEAETDKLLEAANVFRENANAANLQALQTQWLNTKLAWEATEIYDISPIDDLFLHNKIDKYPINQKFVEKNLDKDAEVIDESLVENSGSTTKGLPVLEYLLFRSEAGDDILTQFTESTRATQYVNYVVALCQNLKTQAALVKTEFSKIREEFINNTIDGINGSVNNLANVQVGLIEEILRAKINKPLGNEDVGIPQPQKVETPYANVSLQAIRQNLVGLRNSFVGDESKANLYALLDEVHTGNEEKLSATIAKAFEDSIKEIDQLEGSIAELVNSNPDQLNSLGEAITRLGVAVKVDMANQLGLTIVFNDTDGD
ncbi:MAG: imelysin family protein [Bacteroidota bacterium]